MKKNVKKHFSIILILLLMICTYSSDIALADGRVGTARANPKTSGHQTSETKTYVDTSHWELETKHRRRRVWVEGTGPGTGTGNNGTPGHWTYEYEEYEEYEIVSEGFTISTSWDCDIKFEENFVFTRNNKKENGEPAGMHYKIKIKNVMLNDLPGKITSVSNYHKVNRYQNKGEYYASKVNENKSVGSNFATINGKYEYPYAGDDQSIFSVSCTAYAIFTITKATSVKGVNETITRKITEYYGDSRYKPINSYNSVNFTGKNKRQTDLLFKTEP